MTIEDGAPLYPENDPRYNGSMAAPNIPFVKRTQIDPRVLDRLRSRAQELGRPLTDNERAEIIEEK